MPDPEPLISATPTQKDITASYVGAGVAEPSDYPYFSHEKTLKWISETKQKLPAATPKMREEAFQADPLIKGTIAPYLTNVILQGGKVQTKDNKLYSAAIEEITDWLESIKLIQTFREDFPNFAILTGHSYRRIDYDADNKIVGLSRLDPTSMVTYTDPWDSSIIAYHQHAMVNKSWSTMGTTEQVDSWFIPYTLQNPEIPLTMGDINATYIDERGVGNDLKVFDLFNTYKNKYNISAVSNLRIAAAERIIAMHNSTKIQKHNSYHDDDCDSNNNPAPIDSVILAIWLKRLLLVTSPNLIYAALSPFIHLISGLISVGKDNMGRDGYISTLPKKPDASSATYAAEIANYEAWVTSINDAGKEVVKSLMNGGVFVSGPDLALKPVESSRSVSFQLIKGLIDQLDEEIGQNFGFPLALVKATGTELASSRNILQMFNSIQAGKRAEYEAVADKLINIMFEGRTWQGTTIEDEKEITVTYSFDEIKAHFVLDVPDTKNLLEEAQTLKTKAEALVQIKNIGAGKEDLQALGEEAGFGLLALDGVTTEAPMSPDEQNGGGISGGGAQAINAILKSCLAEVLKEEGLMSASPTDPSGFKEKEIVKKLQEAYQVAQDTIEEVFEEH